MSFQIFLCQVLKLYIFEHFKLLNISPPLSLSLSLFSLSIFLVTFHFYIVYVILEKNNFANDPYMLHSRNIQITIDYVCIKRRDLHFSLTAFYYKDWNMQKKLCKTVMKVMQYNLLICFFDALFKY